MAVNRSLLVKSVDQLGNTFQKTVTHVNPEATNANIDTWSRAFVGLTTNTYQDTIKIETESINEAIAEAEAQGGEG